MLFYGSPKIDVLTHKMAGLESVENQYLRHTWSVSHDSKSMGALVGMC